MGLYTNTFLFAGVGYLSFMMSLLFEPVQRNLVFLYRLRLGSKETLYHPESSGFAQNQVAPFWLTMPDGVKLFGWHILPLDVYAAHKEELRARSATKDAIDSGELAKGHLEILKKDPDARVMIYFHGNSGCISSMHRPDIYRSLISTSPAHTHLFVVDYRGFGISGGTPTENALISDGAFTAETILNLTAVSPDRTILIGQSLGTGVIIGAADFLAQSDSKLEFRALVPIAGFASIEELLSTYKIFGIIPVLAPFRRFKALEELFSRQLQYKFHSDVRIERFVRNSRRTKVLVVHSFDDEQIPYFHGEKLAEAAIKGALESEADGGSQSSGGHLKRFVEMSDDDRSGMFDVVSVGDQQAREYVFWQKFGGTTEVVEDYVELVEESTVSPVSEVRRIGMLAVKWGGHNIVPKSTDVVLAIRNILYED
ncbi:Alpha/Beta hydrolase protein [Lipomyces tetrasporus]|uniref:Alpha/Beta hydrolase protein n=1 Tax=Lipomyces tetrasporus TaxID=54092 RepID=A0AAD7QZU6_9ASCO|nr:Alpha/Beta hydrolase protein [Lipomyces tetrasporus]KAJ8104223.1 Alpha/Beta hydrolase protein [Lipomyces tetrasporus]